jgi:hypothetical protein
MNNRKLTFTISALLLITFIVTSVYAEGDGKNKNSVLNKTVGAPVRSYFNINDILTVFKNTGISDIDINEANSGLVYPKGSGKTAVFQSGFLWGGYRADDTTRTPQVGGTAYKEGLQGGKITNSGLPWPQLTAELETADNVRMYRVRRDVYPGGPFVDLSQDATLEANSADAIRAQYELDWTNWPAADGAPFEDKDNNGIYDPNIDVPGVPGADQTLWHVANDLNSSRTQTLYGALPFGIEQQATYWGYKQSGALGSMFFRKYKIINKSSVGIDSMYVSMWSDVDLGNSTDDFAGCDTLLSLGYCYNANANDATYNPLPPPAVGFDFFQGPKIDGTPLPMTAYYYFARGDANLTDPTQSDPQGSIQFYNFFRGRIGRSGEPFTDPQGIVTPFALYGDPQLGSGWLDGQNLPSGDRRIGSASGPFNMAPGDTQEVVVAEIVAGAIPGVDRISAVGLLKFYDRVAQVAYDNNFDLPTPPPSTIVKTNELDEQIILNWGSDADLVNSIESSNSKGYIFEGYNVYQLPSASATVSEGKRIATYDLINGVGKIEDFVFDVNTGSVIKIPVQFGNDTGIKRFLEVTSDALKGGTPLINGIRYYYAVTAYNFNPDPSVAPNNLESQLQVITVVPQSNAPGVSLGEEFGASIDITHQGTADGTVSVNVVDPEALTNHDYQVFFSERQEIRDANGDWVPAATVKRLFGPDTLTGSSIDIAAVYGISGEIELHCLLNLVSPDDDWSDGLSMTFPAGVNILSAPSFQALNVDAVNGGLIEPVIVGNTINFGDVTQPLTGNGAFEGTEEWVVYIAPTSLPLAVDWVIYDDGYSGGPVDASGTTTVESVGNLSRTAKYWNLKDVTADQVKLENQSVINGVDIYPRRDDIITQVGNDASPIVDGFQTFLNVGYAAPITINSTALNATTLTNTGPAGAPGTNWTDADANWNITDFTFFGNSTGFSNEATGYGSLSVDDLQQDYEFRWTGITGDTVINGQTIVITKSGGSMATIYGARQYSIANHPLNPSPGSTARFLVRVPFEVWNKDQNIQVNYEIYDRGQANPAANGFKVWNTSARMYCQVLNTPYNANAIADPTVDGDNFTWNHVWYASNFTNGDLVDIYYANPIQIGVDTYNFKTTPVGYSDELAKSQINEINAFPNPYYGVNSEELNKYNRFVTFTHLPAKATIRIFNLAGILVKTINKDDAGQYQRWDLANESGLPVASGLYIAHIEFPELGETKILKVAIIQEQQILDRF